ncbi:zinc finger HIT domain-containing protein 1-like [Uloborus diversus]|uniref:zinc finger HIT domain-containing protein 1-like n=1 Tax=Uloborus diversus TaxID=327109 RepID=UPI0024095B54|nr:zinc finger HIT domain-containing protein 1-like [Uloborus diversus]
MASNSSSRSCIKRKVLDENTRKRRIREQLLRLEMDNHHENKDSISDDDITDRSFGKVERKKQKSKKQLGGGKYRKNFTALLEEELANCPPGKFNYIKAVVPPSKYPPRHFCSVCGFSSNYTCVQCGARFCSIKCNGTHKDTRCLKYSV